MIWSTRFEFNTLIFRSTRPDTADMFAVCDGMMYDVHKYCVN